MGWREIGVGDGGITTRDRRRVVAGIGESAQNQNIFVGCDWYEGAAQAEGLLHGTWQVIDLLSIDSRSNRVVTLAEGLALSGGNK